MVTHLLSAWNESWRDSWHADAPSSSPLPLSPKGRGGFLFSIHSRKLATVSALLIAASTSSATACELSDILHARAAIAESNARYTEQRQVHYVTKPIMSGGRLRYQAPDRLEMIVELPKAESFIYQDGVLTVASGDSGFSKDIAVESQVMLSTLFSALVNTLSGDEDKLRSKFDLSFKELNEMFTDSSCVWRLSLVPREERARAKVSSIDVEGTKSRIEKIVLMLANGDSSMMLIREKE